MQNLIEKLGLGERTMSMALWVGLSAILLLVVLALAVWLLRTLRPSLNIGGGQGRGGRPQRLAITDAFSLDRDGRRLVIIRRDNVEHLLLIGGPNDVLVESNITRAERNPRDRAPRATDAEAVQAAESALLNDQGRSEPLLAPPPAPMVMAPSVLPPFKPVSAPPRPAQPPVPPSPPPVQTRQAAPPQPPSVAPTAPPPQGQQRLDEEFERALAAMQATQRQQALRPQSIDAPPAARQPDPTPAAPAPAAPPPVQAPPAPPAPTRPEPMSDMARRLNEVLQKPLSGQLRPPFNKPIPPVPPTATAPPQPPAPAPKVEALLAEDVRDIGPGQAPIPAASASAPPPPAQPAASGTEVEMDLLEEEMARLLGRPGQAPRPEKP